jgi:hypothetical protein
VPAPEFIAANVVGAADLSSAIADFPELPRADAAKALLTLEPSEGSA